MADLLTLENLFNLLMLCFLQAVLGFDNLLYISIESQRAPVAHQKAVRFWGIIIAVALRVVLLFVMMNLIFSFDSVLSALAITKVFPILATAILLSGLAMLVLADGVTQFLQKNRMYEVLGLFILLIVGVVLLGESGQAAAHAMHDDTLALRFFGYEVVPMSKSTFYFSVVVLFVVEIIQSGYSRKLNAERRATAQRNG